MNTAKRLSILATATAAAALAIPSWAQAPAGAAANVHGHVNNAAGQTLTSGNVEFTKDRAEPKNAKMLNTVPIDGSGNYTATGVAPGNYVVYVVQDGKFVDRQEVDLKAGDDKTLDFDMTREAYMKNLSEEERKNIEEFKKKNAEATSANKVIANLNATLKAVREDLHSSTPNYDKDVADMKSATDAKPEEGVLWMTYGDALTAQGDHLTAEDRKSGKVAQSDPAVTKAYSDAVDAYKKGIDLNAASKKPSPADQAVAWNQMGSALAKQGKTQEASTAYETAGKLVPANAGMYYGNEAAVLYNASQTNSALGEAAVAAADKAIAADPKRADSYYIKGQILLQKATLDPKTQKIVPPAGCVEAYQKYLEVAPDGKYAPAVKEVLASLGQKVDTRYNARKK